MSAQEKKIPPSIKVSDAALKWLKGEQHRRFQATGHEPTYAELIDAVLSSPNVGSTAGGSPVPDLVNLPTGLTGSDIQSIQSIPEINQKLDIAIELLRGIEHGPRGRDRGQESSEEQLARIEREAEEAGLIVEKPGRSRRSVRK